MNPHHQPHDSHSLRALCKVFLEAQAIKNFSSQTIDKRRRQLLEFIRWAEQRSIKRADEITRPMLQRFQRHLFYKRTANDQPLSFRSQHNRLSTLRVWFAWLIRNNYLLSNPASELELPKLPRPLPKHVLSPAEAETVLNQADVSTALGLRDRSIMETLYSTGIRRQELANLDVYDVDMGRGVLRIRHGKGDKDRVVPIGSRALAWLEKYQFDVRPDLLIETRQMSLYLSSEGQRLSGSQLGRIVRNYIDLADTGKTGSCHLFRHTMATAMLENGADIRYIQTMLGHAKLDTTQIYTRVSIRKLKEIHEATHPAKATSRGENDSNDSVSNENDPNNGTT